MIKFKDDESLGKTVKKFTAWSFGWEPIKELWDLRFAAGGNKFSQLCTFKFESALPDIEYPTFSIAFVAKLRSKIFHRQANNPSQWYIFKKISPTRTDVLTKDQLLANYGFDLDKFFDSDVFKAMVEKFKGFVKKGLDVEIPKFVKTLKSQDDKNEAERFTKSIVEALPLIGTKRVNNVYYKLLLNPDLEETDVDAKIEEEFKKRGIYADLQIEGEVTDAQQKAWTQMWKKWNMSEGTGEITDDMTKAVPDWKDQIQKMYKGALGAIHKEDFDNAVTAVLDDVNPETHKPFWDECQTFDGFLRAIDYVVKHDLHKFKESELNEYHTDVAGDQRDIDDENPQKPAGMWERDPDYVHLNASSMDRIVALNVTAGDKEAGNILFINRPKKLFSFDRAGYYKDSDSFLPVSRKTPEEMQKFLDSPEMQSMKQVFSGKKLSDFKIKLVTFDTFIHKFQYKKGAQLEKSIADLGEGEVNEASFDQLDWKNGSLTGLGVKQAVDSFKAQDAEKQAVVIYDRATNQFYAIVDIAMAPRPSGWGMELDIDTRKAQERQAQINEASAKETAAYSQSCKVFAKEIIPDILKNKAFDELITYYGEDEQTNKEIGLSWVICALAEELKSSKNAASKEFGTKVSQIGASFML